MKNAFTFYPPIFGFGVENFDGLLIMGMREERSNADLQKNCTRLGRQFNRRKHSINL